MTAAREQRKGTRGSLGCFGLGEGLTSAISPGSH